MSVPLWSVMIPTYNSGEFLKETLESVLAQGYNENDMEIVVVDNCSTDDTKDIVIEVGKGRIKWSQNATNIGMMNNFNECIKQSKGELIHILNSDDIVNHGYYKSFEEQFKKYSDVALVSCNSEIIDENGNVIGRTSAIISLRMPSNDIKDLVYFNFFRTPAVCVRKIAYDVLGGFDPSLIQTADWDMWVRVIDKFKGFHIDKDLCKYREHSNNGSSKVAITGENILDTERLFNKFYALGFPIDKYKSKYILAEHSKGQYEQHVNSNNVEGAVNLLKLYKRYANTFAYVSFMLRGTPFSYFANLAINKFSSAKRLVAKVFVK